MSSSIKSLLGRAEMELRSIAGERAFIEARILLSRLTKVSKEELIFRENEILSSEVEREFGELVERRKAEEPMSHLLGKKAFYKSEFMVNPSVLIPRPETETLVEEVIRWAKSQNRPLKIVDLGTGSGCIGLSLAREIPLSEVSLVDISEQAVETAKRNAAQLGVEKLSFFLHDMHQVLDETFDIIVSNPPYLSESNWCALEKGIRDYEPKLALVADHDGLEFYEILLTKWWDKLAQNGLMAFETRDAEQSEQIQKFMPESLRKSAWVNDCHLFIVKHA